MKKIALIFTIIFTAIISCKEEKKEVADSNTDQMKQVMSIHDEVMPKMSTIGKLVGELNEKADSTAIGIQYENAKNDLQDAHKSMMDWMQGFGDRFDSDEILNGKELTEQKQKWLDEEEEKVKALREQINESIENAKKVLSEEK